MSRTPNPRRAEGNRAKQSQCPATPGGTGPGGRVPWDEMRETNPIRTGAICRGKSCMGKELWWIDRHGTSAKQSQFTPPPTGTVGGRQGRRWSATRDNRAKQTQFLHEQNEGQVVCGKGVMVNSTFDRPRQNKPNLPGGSRGAIAPNKPNLPGYAKWGEARGTGTGGAVQTNPIRWKPAGGGGSFPLRTAAEDLQSGDLVEDRQ